MEKHQTDRKQQQRYHPPSNKIKTQYTEKAQPPTPTATTQDTKWATSRTPHHTSEISPTYSKTQMSKLPSKAKTR
jgi:hypothetical protein